MDKYVIRSETDANKHVHDRTLILGIVGSRNFTDYDMFCRHVDEFVKNNHVTSIVSGGARGADSMAERWAHEHNVPIMVYHAEWTKYGRSAGPRRNMKIVADSSYILAFPSKDGHGTQNTIAFASKKGIMVVTHYVD